MFDSQFGNNCFPEVGREELVSVCYKLSWDAVESEASVDDDVSDVLCAHVLPVGNEVCIFG